MTTTDDLTPAEDLVCRGAGAALITVATYDRLVVGADEDVCVRLELRLAEHARNEGQLDDWARHLWAAIDRTREGDEDDEPQPS